MSNEQLLKVIDNLYEEAIINKPSHEVFMELTQNPNDTSSRNLPFIKRLNAKSKSTLRQNKTQKAMDKFKSMVEKFGGVKEFAESLLNKPQHEELRMQLFSKFENLTEDDKSSMMLDQKLLELLEEIDDEIIE